MQTGEILVFGPFRLDRRNKQLFRNEELVPLTPKVFETLLYLVDNSGRLVTKSEILRSVWPDRVVEEANVVQNVSVLRRALGEIDDQTKYIVNFPGRGYQFTMPVQRLHGERAAAVPVSRSGWRWGLAAMSLAVAIAGIWYWMTRGGSRLEREGKRTPVTRLAGSEWLPAVSADGRKVAFLWDRNGQAPAAVFVAGVGDAAPRQMSTGRWRYSSPAWSPDGRNLACLRFEDDWAVVALIREGGGEEPILRLFPRRYGLEYWHLDWSPDGKLLAVDDKKSDDQPFSIFLVDLVTRERKLLTPPEAGDIGDLAPRFSPDGRFVSFVRKPMGHGGALMVAPISGGVPTAVSPPGAEIGGHDWLDDSTVLFSSNHTGEFRLWRASVKRRSAAEPVFPSIVSSAPIQFSVPRSLRDRLAFSELKQDLNIWRLDLRSPGVEAARWTRLIDSTGEDVYPQYSPDGRRICFRSDRSGEPQLWVGDPEGANVVQVTRGRRRPTIPRWSPDSRSVAFSDQVDRRLWIVNVDTGVARQLPPAIAHAPAFSGDGRLIFFNHGSALWSYALPDGPATRIDESVGFPKETSPDGGALYYIKGRTGGTIFRRSLADGRTMEVVNDLLPGYWGSWTVTRQGLWYLSSAAAEPERYYVSFLDFATGKTSRFAEFSGYLPPIGNSMWSVSPDGRYLLCVRGDRAESDVLLVTIER